MSELPIAEVDTSDNFSLPSIVTFTTYAQQVDLRKQDLNLENIITRKTVALFGGFSALHAPFFSQPGLLQQIISKKPAQLVVYYFSLQEEEVFRFEQFCHLYLDIPVILVRLSLENSFEHIPLIDTLCIDDNACLETIPMSVLQRMLSFQNPKDSYLVIGLSQWNASLNVHIRAINSMNSNSQKPSIMPVLSKHAFPSWLRFYCDTFDSIQLGVFSHRGELELFDEIKPTLQ